MNYFINLGKSESCISFVSCTLVNLSKQEKKGKKERKKRKNKNE